MLNLFRKNTRSIIWTVIAAFIMWGGYAVGSQLDRSGRFSGELFGKPISFQEFDTFYRSAQLFSFGDSGSKEPKPAEILRQQTWENIMLSKEARNEKIDVTDDEVRDEIFRLMKLQQIENPTPQIYQRWVQSSIRETPRVFEGQIRELLRIQKLVQKVNGSAVSTPSDKDLMALFHRDEDKLSFETAQFKTQEEAKSFLDKVRKTNDFKSALPKDKTVNSGTLMSLDVLINHWHVPEAEALKLVASKKGAVSEVIQTGENFSVFKVIEAKPVLEKDFTDELKKKYSDGFTTTQKQERFFLWVTQLQVRANLKDFQSRQKA